MNRYWLFAGVQHYPWGGMEDYITRSDDHHILKSIVLDNDDDINRYTWAHILDSTTMTVVCEYSNYEKKLPSPAFWDMKSEPITHFSSALFEMVEREQERIQQEQNK